MNHEAVYRTAPATPGLLNMTNSDVSYSSFPSIDLPVDVGDTTKKIAVGLFEQS